MNKLSCFSLLLIFICFTVNANLPYAQFDLPQTTHIHPSGNGGYFWIDSGNPSSKNILDRLPQTHSIEPDGSGGFYYR